MLAALYPKERLMFQDQLVLKMTSVAQLDDDSHTKYLQLIRDHPLGEDDATVVSEMAGSGSVLSFQEKQNINVPPCSPSKGGISPGAVLVQKKRLKKRTIEDQLAAWREEIGKSEVAVSTSTSTEHFADGRPPFVDWGEPDADIASNRTGAESGNELSLVDSLGSSHNSMPLLVDCEEADSYLQGRPVFSNGSAIPRIFWNTENSNTSLKDTKSMSSGGIFATPDERPRRSSSRRASMGSVPLVSARVTTGEFISNIILKTSMGDSQEELRSPDLSVRFQKCKSQRRASMGSYSLPSSAISRGESSSRQGSLSGVMPRHEENMSLSDHIVSSPGKVILRCRPQGSQSIVSGASSLTSDHTATTSQKPCIKSKPLTKVTRFCDKATNLSTLSNVNTVANNREKVATTTVTAKASQDTINVDSITGKHRGMYRNDPEDSSVGSYETMHSCSTRKQIRRTNSGISMASSIDSTEKSFQESSKPSSYPGPAVKNRKCKFRQDRRNSTGGLSNNMPKAPKAPYVVFKGNKKSINERRGTASQRPSTHVNQGTLTSNNDHSTGTNDRRKSTNVRAQRRMSTGTTILHGSLVDQSNSQHTARKNLEVEPKPVRSQRRMSTGTSSSKYTPFTTNLKEEINQVTSTKPMNGRAIASVDLWNGSNTTSAISTSWRSNAEKPSSLLSASSSKHSSLKPDSSRSDQSPKSQQSSTSLQRQKQELSPANANPSRSRRFIGRLNIFNSKSRKEGDEERTGKKQRRRASANGAAPVDPNEDDGTREKAYQAKGPRARRRASTGEASEDPYRVGLSHDLTMTGSVFPRKPVQLLEESHSKKRAGGSGRRLSMGMLRGSVKKQ